MHSMAASARVQRTLAVIFAGVFGLVPGLVSAQSTGAENLVARCDLPVVDLFNPTAGDLVLPGSYLISGVALDPLAQQGSGIDQVSFYLGRRDQGGLALGSVTPSGGMRQQSFSVAVDLPNADPGTQHQLVAYAHSQLSDKTTELSLPIVMGKDTSHPALANPFLNTINTNPGTIPANCAGSSAARSR